MENIKVINKSNNPLPKFQTIGSAGMDICAHLENKIYVKSGERKLIPTGLFMEIPIGYEAQMRPRSGLAMKHGINIVGTIDSDYRGEINVIFFNTGHEEFAIQNGDRIAQMIIAKHEKPILELVESLSDSDRGNGGFGHTGNN